MTVEQIAKNADAAPVDASDPRQVASPAELLFPDLEKELETTRRMLEIVPAEPADWRPHDRSWTLSQLATHVAELPGFPSVMLALDELEIPEFRQPRDVADPDERLAIFDEEAGKLRDLVSSLTWDRATATWMMRVDGEVVMKGVRSELVRRYGISHIAHHRAQLGVYLRLLDVEIPGAYGPSADEASEARG